MAKQKLPSVTLGAFFMVTLKNPETCWELDSNPSSGNPEDHHSPRPKCPARVP